MSDSPSNSTAPATPTARGRGPGVAQLAIVVAILAAGVIITALTSDVAKVSEPGVRVVDEKPVLSAQAGAWEGGPLEGLSQEERDILPADTEGARRRFTNQRTQQQLYCSIILAGRDVTSIHRPELCLPGQGWTITSEYIETVPVAAAPGGVLQVMRMNATRPVRVAEERTVQVRSVFTYWFVGKDRVTPHHWQRILWTTRDRVLHNKNHRWAYILIHAPVALDVAATDPQRADQDAMELIKQFIQDLYPTLVAGGDPPAG